MITKQAKAFIKYFSAIVKDILKRIKRENQHKEMGNQDLLVFKFENGKKIQMHKIIKEFNDLLHYLEEASNDKKTELNGLFEEETESFEEFFKNLKKQLNHKIKHQLNSMYNVNIKLEDNIELIKMDASDLIEGLNDYVKNMIRKENLELLKQIENIEYLFKQQMRAVHEDDNLSANLNLDNALNSNFYSNQMLLLEEVIYHEFLSIEHMINKSEIQMFYNLNKLLKSFTKSVEKLFIDLQNTLKKEIYKVD